MARRDKERLIRDVMRAWREARLSGDIRDDHAFATMEINRTDGRCLDVLDDGPKASSELAAACGISANAMTAAVDRLAARGLVERVRDDNDRRRVLVTRTRLADQLRAKIYGPVAEWASGNLRRYTVSELETIERFLADSVQVQSRHIEFLGTIDAGQRHQTD